MKQKKSLPFEQREKPRQATKIPTSASTFLVEGMAALQEYARFKPESILEVWCKPTLNMDVQALLERCGVEVAVAPVSEKPGAPVPPVQARVKLKTLTFQDIASRLETRSRDVIVALDHITDPRNLGAIVRSAAFFGAREVIAPERRQVLLTQASVGTAQGGFALTDLICVSNLARTLDDLKQRGYWIIGTAVDGEALSALAGVYQKLVLVLGAEDSGISRLVREKCDRIGAIRGQTAGLDSLNVSVAAGIFLNALATS